VLGDTLGGGALRDIRSWSDRARSRDDISTGEIRTTTSGSPKSTPHPHVTRLLAATVDREATGAALASPFR